MKFLIASVAKYSIWDFCFENWVMPLVWQRFKFYWRIGFRNLVPLYTCIYAIFSESFETSSLNAYKITLDRLNAYIAAMLWGCIDRGYTVVCNIVSIWEGLSGIVTLFWNPNVPFIRPDQISQRSSIYRLEWHPPRRRHADRLQMY